MFGIATQPDLYFKSTMGVAKNPNRDRLDHFRYAQDNKTQTGPIYSASLMLRNCTTETEFLSKTRFLFVLCTFFLHEPSTSEVRCHTKKQACTPRL